MQNVKFRGPLALFAADAKKNQTILNSIVFTVAQYMVHLEKKIREFFARARL